ncbi:hypothetical protein BS47DRAFT_1357206 [Hydnum rufescens UP504]|uniref:Uncharacterized protein n=1 Tax=Hydnum rufescens UP504 TaxID=1448309 RepID=A0A9P6BAX1_9AGAM|nr:hypothetical protein BS47DRAFT_1357206 [Hydnum rufescens UP504]
MHKGKIKYPSVVGPLELSDELRVVVQALSEKGLEGLGPFTCPCQYLGSPCDAELLPVTQQQHDPLGSLLQGYLTHLQLLLGITERNLLDLHREGWYIMREVPEEESKEELRPGPVAAAAALN